MAASWDPKLLYEWGSGMGREFYGKGSRANQSGYAFTQTASEQSPAAADMDGGQ